MSKEKRSFFERLTGAVRMDEDVPKSRVRHPPTAIAAEPWSTPRSLARGMARTATAEGESLSHWIDEDTDKEAELTVDVYQTPDMIVVKSMIAGVRARGPRRLYHPRHA